MNTNEQAYLSELVDLLAAAPDRESLADILQALLTEAELKEIPKRLQIVRMLSNGIPQREIAKQLGVGIATVTRGSKAMGQQYRILEQLNGQ